MALRVSVTVLSDADGEKTPAPPVEFPVTKGAIRTRS